MALTPAWLFGLPVSQPRQYRRLTRIRSSVYRTVATLDAEIVRSPEPIPFEELDRSAFRPVRPGTAWGGVFDCAWLRITGDVPPDASDPVVLLGIGGEGLVVSPDGELLDSVSTVFQQGDHPHSGGRYRPVRGADLSSGRVELYADVTYNGWLLYEIGRPRYYGARLAERDDVAFALYYDYLTLVVLAGATEDAGLAEDLRSALDEAWRRFRAGDAAAARAALAPALAAGSEHDFEYSAVGHGHLDMAWLWPIRETKRKAARTYVRALRGIEERDGYVYGTSQPQQLEWMRQRHPALFERIRGAVADGRIELQGSFWVEPDTNLPSGESLVRQAVVGRRFLQEHFGLDDESLRLCWLPDTFGYSGNLPQILRGTGMDWFQTIKLAWNTTNVFPHRTFRWAGIDGSSVLVHMPPEGDYNSRAGADNLLTGLRQYPERSLGSALLVYGSGDGGGGPGEIHHELLERERSLRGLPRVRRRTATEFFRELESRDIPHTHHGELYLETHQGTYTTQARIKQLSRRADRALHDVEALAAATGQRPDLEQHWRDVLLNQFHDILPGSSIERVNREAIADYERVIADLEAQVQRLLDLLPRAEQPSALNLTGLPRREHVAVDDRWFLADVPAYSSAALTPAAEHPELEFSSQAMGNGILTVRFDAGGQIVSCLDAAGGEHAGTGLGRLVLHRDPFVFPFNAWDIDSRALRRPGRPLRLVSAQTRIDGPRVVRTHEYRGPKVAVRQRVVLEAGSALVRFETEVDWRQKHRMLRAEFRPSHYGPAARSEIQFGHIERPTTERDSVETAQFEVCAHRWIATEDESGGFAVLNDAKYGHRAKNGLISLALLRAPTYPDRTADRGQHSFTYAFLPFGAGDLGSVIREGYRMNHPLRITDAALEPIATSSDPGVIVETIKPAEGGRGVVLRLYESLGRPATTRVVTSIPHSRAVRTDLLERETGPADLDALVLRPFEIATVLLEAP